MSSSGWFWICEIETETQPCQYLRLRLRLRLKKINFRYWYWDWDCNNFSRESRRDSRLSLLHIGQFWKAFSPNDEKLIFSPHISLVLLSSRFVAIKRPQRKFTTVSRSDKKCGGGGSSGALCIPRGIGGNKNVDRDSKVSKLSMSVGTCVIHDQFKNYFEKLPVALQRSEVTAICGFALERSHYSHRAL